MRPTIFLSFTFLLCTLGIVPFLHAQEEGDGPGRGRGRIDEFRRMKLIETVDMTEDQTVRYFAREKDFRQQESEFLDRRKELVGKLRKLSQQSGNDEEIMKTIQQFGTVNQDIIRKRLEFLTSLKDILSAKQIAQLVVFEDEFLRQVRKVVQEYGRNRKR